MLKKVMLADVEFQRTLGMNRPAHLPDIKGVGGQSFLRVALRPEVTRCTKESGLPEPSGMTESLFWKDTAREPNADACPTRWSMN